MSIRRCDVNDRISGFPFEPFDRNTDIYPHYVTFMKDGIKVRVPIGIDSVSCNRAKQNSALFLKFLTEQLKSMYFDPNDESSLNSQIRISQNDARLQTVMADVSKDEVVRKADSMTPLDRTEYLSNELKRVSRFYRLSRAEVEESIQRTYRLKVTASALCEFRRLRLSMWSIAKLEPLIQRWLNDMKTPSRRALLFPPHHLRANFARQFERLSWKSVTFPENQLKEISAFYAMNPKPRDEDISELSIRFGATKIKIMRWFSKKNQLMR